MTISPGPTALQRADLRLWSELRNPPILKGTTSPWPRRRMKMRRDTQQFEPRPEVVRDVRAFVTEAARRAEVDESAATLAASELAANVVRHARTPFSVHVTVASEYLRVEFVDGSPVLPTVREFTEDGDGGRGMRLVHALTTGWGVECYSSGGKGVWFELGGVACGVVNALSPSS